MTTTYQTPVNTSSIRLVSAQQQEQAEAHMAQLAAALQQLAQGLEAPVSSTSTVSTSEPTTDTTTTTEASAPASTGTQSTTQSTGSAVTEMLLAMGRLQGKVADSGAKRAEFENIIATDNNKVADDNVASAKKAWHHYCKEKREAKGWGLAGKIFGGIVTAIIDVVACATGQFYLAAIATAIYIGEVSGGTAALTQALAQQLHDAGMSQADADLLASVIVTVVVVALSVAAAPAAAGEEAAEEGADAAAEAAEGAADAGADAAGDGAQSAGQRALDIIKSGASKVWELAGKVPPKVAMGLQTMTQMANDTDMSKAVAEVYVEKNYKGLSKEKQEAEVAKIQGDVQIALMVATVVTMFINCASLAQNTTNTFRASEQVESVIEEDSMIGFLKGGTIDDGLTALRNAFAKLGQIDTFTTTMETARKAFTVGEATAEVTESIIEILLATTQKELVDLEADSQLNSAMSDLIIDRMSEDQQFLQEEMSDTKVSVSALVRADQAAADMMATHSPV